MALDRPMSMLMPGFGALLRKEMLDASRSKRLIIFVCVMTFILIWIPIGVYIDADTVDGGVRHRLSRDNMDDMTGSWAGIVGYLGSLMVIAATIDAVVRERSLGVTAWIVTKPVSRLAYLAAKSVGHAISSIITIVLIPSAVWLVLTLLLFSDVPVGQVAGAVLVLCAEMIFLSFAVIALGVPLKSVTPIALLSLGLWFVPVIAPWITRAEWLLYVLPSYLPVAAIAVAYRGWEHAEFASIPIASIVIAGVIFAAAAAWFERQEL